MAGEALKSRIGNIIESGKNRIETTKKDIGSIAGKAVESGKNFVENTKDAIGNTAEKVMPLAKAAAGKAVPILGYAKKVAHGLGVLPALDTILEAKEIPLKLFKSKIETNNSNTPKNNSNTPKNNDGNNDEKKKDKRGSGILGILTRIAGKAYDNANAAVGNNTDLYGLAKDLTGYTNAEIRNKEIDSSIAVKQAIDSALGVQSGIANLYKNDKNFKEYMDRSMGIFQRLFNYVANGSILPDDLEKTIMDIYEEYKNEKEGNK